MTYEHNAGQTEKKTSTYAHSKNDGNTNKTGTDQTRDQKNRK